MDFFLDQNTGGLIPIMSVIPMITAGKSNLQDSSSNLRKIYNFLIYLYKNDQNIKFNKNNNNNNIQF